MNENDYDGDGGLLVRVMYLGVMCLVEGNAFLMPLASALLAHLQEESGLLMHVLRREEERI